MTTFTKFAASLVAALTLTVAPYVHAQNNAVVARVNVPFAFEVGSQHFAPGVYTVQMLSRHTIAVLGDKTSASTMVTDADGTAPNGSSQVSFHKVGQQYFLVAVWKNGAADHLQCVDTGSEQKAIHNLEAANRAGVPLVNVAVLERP